MPNTGPDDWVETDPQITDPRQDGALEITSLRGAVKKRVDKEHVALGVITGGSLATGGGEHKPGSAKVFVGPTAPTLRPDGSTALAAADDGRLWIKTVSDVPTEIHARVDNAWVKLSDVPPAPLRLDGVVAVSEITSNFNHANGYTNGSTKLELVTWAFASADMTANHFVQWRPNGGSFQIIQNALGTGSSPEVAQNTGTFLLNPGDTIRLNPTLATGTRIARRARFTL
jgi:hypothetical protein